MFDHLVRLRARATERGCVRRGADSCGRRGRSLGPGLVGVGVGVGVVAAAAATTAVVDDDAAAADVVHVARAVPDATGTDAAAAAVAAGPSELSDVPHGRRG